MPLPTTKPTIAELPANQKDEENKVDKQDVLSFSHRAVVSSAFGHDDDEDVVVVLVDDDDDDDDDDDGDDDDEG